MCVTGWSRVLGGLASDLVCMELPLGLGERSRGCVAWLGDCDKSLVMLLTNALVSDWLEPLLVHNSVAVPETAIVKESQRFLHVFTHRVFPLTQGGKSNAARRYERVWAAAGAVVQNDGLPRFV